MISLGELCVYKHNYTVASVIVVSRSNDCKFGLQSDFKTFSKSHSFLNPLCGLKHPLRRNTRARRKMWRIKYRNVRVSARTLIRERMEQLVRDLREKRESGARRGNNSNPFDLSILHRNLISRWNEAREPERDSGRITLGRQ